MPKKEIINAVLTVKVWTHLAQMKFFFTNEMTYKANATMQIDLSLIYQTN